MGQLKVRLLEPPGQGTKEADWLQHGVRHLRGSHDDHKPQPPVTCPLRSIDSQNARFKNVSELKFFSSGPHLGLLRQGCQGEEAVGKEVLCLYPISWCFHDPISLPLCSLLPSPLFRSNTVLSSFLSSHWMK